MATFVARYYIIYVGPIISGRGINMPRKVRKSKLNAGDKMKKIGKLIVGSGEGSADMRYATRLSTPDAFIWGANDRTAMAVLSSLEFDRASEQARPGLELLREDELDGSGCVEKIVKLAELMGVSGFAVPAEFPLFLADELRAAGLTLEPTEEGEFFPEREFKSEDEVALVVKSLRAAEAGVDRAARVLADSSVAADGTLVYDGATLTSERLRAEIDTELLRHGTLPTGTICAGGPQGACPHNAGEGPLYANAPIVMDVFPRSTASGYWGDLTRTMLKGKAPQVVASAYRAVREARDHAKNLIRPGANPEEIHKAAASILEKHGFFTGRNDAGDFGFFHGLGHGVGLEIHEAPRLSPRNSTPLAGGEIVTVEPGLYYPEWGGIRLEDMVFVEPGAGCRCLTKCADFLEIP